MPQRRRDARQGEAPPPMCDTFLKEARREEIKNGPFANPFALKLVRVE